MPGQPEPERRRGGGFGFATCLGVGCLADGELDSAVGKHTEEGHCRVCGEAFADHQPSFGVLLALWLFEEVDRKLKVALNGLVEKPGLIRLAPDI